MLGGFNASSASIEIIRSFSSGGSYTISGTATANTFDFRGATVLDALIVNAGDGNDTLFGSDVAEDFNGGGQTTPSTPAAATIRSTAGPATTR